MRDWSVWGLDPQRAKEIGGYRLRKSLGRGGMGAVYLATEIRSKRRGALCVSAKQHRDDAAYWRRFRQEAQRAQELEHVHIVKTYGLVESESVPFLVMESVEGTDLECYLHEHGLPEVDGVFDPAEAPAEALACAHEQGVVHRDVRPGNLLLGKDGSIKLADLGLARGLLDPEPQEGPEIFGTPEYRAPSCWPTCGACV